MIFWIASGAVAELIDGDISKTSSNCPDCGSCLEDDSYYCSSCGIAVN